MTTVPRCKGSYTQRKGTEAYQIKYPLGWSELKKKYDEYHEEVGSEAEAIALIKELNDFVYHGGSPLEIPTYRNRVETKVEANGLKFSEFAETYCTLRQKQKLASERTIRSDQECLKRTMPYLGKKLLTSISPHDIDSMYAAMRNTGAANKNGHVYSGTTLQRTHTVLNAVLNKALDYEYIEKNPCAKIEKPKSDTAEKRSLSKSEAQGLYSRITDEELSSYTVGILLGLFCGLRLSEMLALNWEDYSNQTIRVCKSQAQEQQSTKATKNGEDRAIPCPPALVGVLETWRRQQSNYLNTYELEISENTPIVNSKTGNHILQSNYCKWFTKASVYFNLPEGFTFHGLRHTFVTLMSRECGVDDRTTRAISGHKSNQAFQIYTHTNEDWMREAAARFNAVISPKEQARCCQHCSCWSPSPTGSAIGACWLNAPKTLCITNANDGCKASSFSLSTST